MPERDKGNHYVDPEKFFVVHPDQQEWLRRYNGDHASIQKLFEERQKKLDEGQPFWNTDHDSEMSETAEQRSHEVKKKGLFGLFGGD